MAAIDPDRRQLRCADGTSCDFGALLLATGAEPVHLSLPGSDKARVFCLRSLADSQALIAAAAGAHRTVNVGVSFIRLEVGGVVAFISRIGRLNDPWVDLVNYFRDASVTQIKFRLLADAVTRLA